jgi:hypothetical protein
VVVGPDAAEMIRLLTVALVLLLGSVLYAQSQVDLYKQAMMAEEAGNVTESVALFEQALAAGGEYSDEIREILSEYYDALGLSEDGSGAFSFRLQSDVGFYGLRYTEFDAKKDSLGNATGDISENAGDLFASLNVYLDYSTGNWIHSLGLTFVSDWFFDNKEMPVLDTNDWTIAPGLEYSLVGRDLLLDVGVDFNITNDGDFKPAGYAWVEYDIYKFDKQRVGVAALGYYRKDGPSTASVFGSFHRSATTGLNASAYVGAKYEADYLADILTFVNGTATDCERNEWGVCVDQGNVPMVSFEDYWNQCVADHGEEACADVNTGLMQQYMEQGWNEQMQQWNNWQDTSSVELSRYWSRWVGPSLRGSISYIFSTDIALELSVNMFYALLVDGASEEYEKMQKFTGTWGFKFSWNPRWFTIYAGIEQTFLDYNLPETLSKYFTERNLLTSFKTGVKVDF